MAVENLKSTSVTNLDSTPVTANTSGKGASGRLECVSEYVTVSAGASDTSTYQFVRIPTNAVVKQIWWESTAMTAGTIDLGVYYSSATNDGTPVADQGTAVDSNFFATLIAVNAAVTPTDVTNESGTYTVDLRNEPIWQAAGLSADPGGMFDIVGTVNTTAVTASGKIGITVYYNV